MSNPVGENALLECTFGNIPTPLHTNTICVSANMFKLATMMDYAPFVNIRPFGMCQSLANPMVASATAAAQGVLTPMPCIPVIVASWTNTQFKIKINGFPILTNESKCYCAYAGCISVKLTTLKKINI